MAIFGTQYPKLIISASGEELNLERVKFDYYFFNPDVVEHVSVLTGYRSYAYSRNQSSFNLDINLCNYSSSEAKTKFEKLYQNRNEAWLIYPHSNYISASVDVYQTPIQYYITQFTPYYLDGDNTYDALFITFSPRKNSVLYSFNLNQGYGLTPYGANYGF